mgnify:CR=1 FL=1
MLGTVNNRPYGPQMSKTYFANGWGVSIIEFAFSRGTELAVIGPDGEMHYDNPVAQGDTRGWLTDEEVRELTSEVASWSEDQTFPNWEEE